MDTISTPRKKNHYQHKSVLTWENIVKEVMARKANGQKTSILSSDLENSSFGAKTTQKKSLKSNKSTYVLRTKYSNIPITKREAECISLLLKSKSVINIASILKIAPDTVKDYINNIKARTGCNNRRQLIDIVRTNKNLP